MQNKRIVAIFDRIANLLEIQGAASAQVRTYRRASDAVRACDQELVDIYHHAGRAGLEAIPCIGPRIATSLVELFKTGRDAMLDRLTGDPPQPFATLPGIGRTLGERIHRELGLHGLDELDEAARDGRLLKVEGLGERRVAAIRDLLADRVHLPAPSVAALLEIDRRYREAAAASVLPMIAPKRFNPGRTPWLPILHVERDGWSMMVMFSNSATAHRWKRTHDWVVVYFHDAEVEGQATIVTEHVGPLTGKRVVRNREAECARFYEAHATAA